MSTDMRFGRWLEWILRWEGTVFENDPDDPGGATKFGIDQRSHPEVDIRGLTREMAAGIYWDEYWTRCRAHEMPARVGEVVANIAVNAGHGRAASWLQAAVGAAQDGIIGRRTLALVWQADRDALVETLLDRTEAHYRSIAKGRLAKFLKGWLNRNGSLREVVCGW